MQEQTTPSSVATVDASIGQTLRWALVVATYRRAEVLAQCVECALRQTRPPAEIIIVDASDDWEASKASIGALCKDRSDVRLLYERAAERSLTAQRNQGIALATADILFLIDDDSLMRLDAADEVMRIYEADVNGEVAGIRLVRDPAPKLADGQVSPVAVEPPKPRGGVANRVRRLLRADHIGVPYDRELEVGDVPEALRRFDVGSVADMVGYAMTARRETAVSEPFGRILSAYAAGEDTDFSYRLRRHGLLLLARRAMVHHLAASSGRLPVGVVTALGALNPIVMHRIHGADQRWSRRQLRGLTRRRLVIELVKDLHQHDWTLPRARGIAFALRHLNDIFARTPDELEAWYPRFQRRLIEQRK